MWKFFDCIQDLQEHIKSHETRCQECNYTFKSLGSLQEHKKLCFLKMQTGGPFKPFECDKCMEVLGNQLSLKEHIAKHDLFSKQIEKTPYKKKLSEKCEICGIIYDGDTSRAAEIILNHKIKCRTEPSHNHLKCGHCIFVGSDCNELKEHIKNDHEELLSPEPKKSKFEIEDQTLNKMQSLSVSEVKKPNLPDEMDIDQEKKRKR